MSATRHEIEMESVALRKKHRMELLCQKKPQNKVVVEEDETFFEKDPFPFSAEIFWFSLLFLIAWAIKYFG